MTKTELKKLSESIVLPKGWIVQETYPRSKNNPNDMIVLGYPIEERLNVSYETRRRKFNKVLKQLNSSNDSSRKWVEFGGGCGVGGKYYDVTVGLEQ